MPSIYPDEYILLKPDEKWEGTQSLWFLKGEIKTYEGTKSNPRWKVVHNGYYLACPNCPSYDSVLLPQSARREVKVSAKYTTANPDFKNFTKEDCDRAHIPWDAFPEDFTSNKIDQSVKCDPNSCPDYYADPLSPMDFGDINNLAVFCQHYSSLTKTAWIGTLESTPLTVHLKEQ